MEKATSPADFQERQLLWCWLHHCGGYILQEGWSEFQMRLMSLPGQVGYNCTENKGLDLCQPIVILAPEGSSGTWRAIQQHEVRKYCLTHSTTNEQQRVNIRAFIGLSLVEFEGSRFGTHSKQRQEEICWQAPRTPTQRKPIFTSILFILQYWLTWPYSSYTCDPQQTSERPRWVRNCTRSKSEGNKGRTFRRKTLYNPCHQNGKWNNIIFFLRPCVGQVHTVSANCQINKSYIFW